ncbi:MAG TPA: LysR family transcriptional regulator, partial [Candidatus Competibacteraceae bacterium]|nr:LysR family transcriptional regulator [Candidatus Competibacteraceae bacterium]
VRGYSHFLGESDLTVFAAPQLAQSLAGDFPVSLNRAPFLLPGDDVALRPDLLRWFEAQRLYPHIVGEFEDSALLKAFGQAGAGLFVAPTAIADYVTQQYTVQAIGRIEAVTERLYAI